MTSVRGSFKAFWDYIFVRLRVNIYVYELPLITYLKSVFKKNTISSQTHPTQIVKTRF